MSYGETDVLRRSNKALRSDAVDHRPERRRRAEKRCDTNIENGKLSDALKVIEFIGGIEI